MNQTEKIPAKHVKVGDRLQTRSAGVCTVTGIKDAEGCLAISFAGADTSHIPPDFMVFRVVSDG